MMLLVASVVFLALYWAIASGTAWCLYRLARGYEAAPTLVSFEVWKRSILAGAVAIGIVILMALAVVGAGAIVGGKPSSAMLWVLFGVEFLGWTFYCIWLCELENFLQGMIYAVLWMILLRVVAFLVFLPFGVAIVVFGGLGFAR